MRPPERHLPAFTLIELLTVISIISLLIAILLPSLSQARRAAQDATSKAGLHTFEVGIEMFHSDSVNNGQYPPSRLPEIQAGQAGFLSGANWLAFSMLGIDLLGWDPNALPLSSRNQAWYAPNGEPTSRKGPYVDVDTIRSRPETDGGNPVPVNSIWSNTAHVQGGKRVLVDKVYFRENSSDPRPNHVILYYRANPAAQSSWPFVPPGADPRERWIYDWTDNQNILLPDSQSWDTVPGLLAQPEYFYSTGQYSNDAYVLNKEATLATGNTLRRPHRGDSFLLVSPGFDGEYGTTDDITNFNR